MDKKLYIKLLQARRQLRRVELSPCCSPDMVDNYRKKVEHLEKRLGIKKGV